MLASPLPSFPSLVIFYTTSERKLGGHGCLEQDCLVIVVIMKSFSTFVHVLKLKSLYIPEHSSGLRA